MEVYPWQLACVCVCVCEGDSWHGYLLSRSIAHVSRSIAHVSRSIAHEPPTRFPRTHSATGIGVLMLVSELCLKCKKCSQSIRVSFQSCNSSTLMLSLDSTGIAQEVSSG